MGKDEERRVKTEGRYSPGDTEGGRVRMEKTKGERERGRHWERYRGEAHNGEKM
jgi:hypothetical protein